MGAYYHSVRLLEEKCKGCTNCIKRCPTEAIRVRQGKAVIIEERCVDCGECIRVCPNHAKVAVADDLTVLKSFPKNIALPAPALLGQFGRSTDEAHILGALLELGFDDVVEVAVAADMVSEVISQYLQSGKGPRPAISSACPAVVRLMQVRFPSLLDNIVPFEPPMEIAARLARESFGFGEVGVHFITPCPAKITAVKQPVSYKGPLLLDGAIPISAIYGEMMKRLNSARPFTPRATSRGIGWGRSGGEGLAIQGSSVLSVDGIHNVIAVLEEVERGRLSGVDYIEAQACTGGCVGGCLTVQNPFVGRTILKHKASEASGRKALLSSEALADMYRTSFFDMSVKITPRPVMRLDTDIKVALAKVNQMEQVAKELPGLDCGACGSPNCKALAEDIVQGRASELDCIFKLREKVQGLAEAMVEVARQLPPPVASRAETEKGERRDG
ncbi:MAG TPA: 4Fe-4S binding protein [Firmicutes bacterium]|nr:4Fe-4S binding protein [Bacillota bacterium]